MWSDVNGLFCGFVFVLSKLKDPTPDILKWLNEIGQLDHLKIAHLKNLFFVGFLLLYAIRNGLEMKL